MAIKKYGSIKVIKKIGEEKKKISLFWHTNKKRETLAHQRQFIIQCNKNLLTLNKLIFQFDLVN